MRALLASAVCFATLGAASFALPPQVVAQTTAIVVANAIAATDRDGGFNLPFNFGNFASSSRFQQVYLASQFSTLGPTGGVITQIIFRQDGINGSMFSSTLPNVRIDLSTTGATPTTLSGTFANNVGADDLPVFGGFSGAPLVLSSSATGPAGGPKPFDIVINLATPFFYNPLANPLASNLLLDVRVGNYGGVSTTAFDSDSSAVVGVATTITSGVNSPTADFVNGGGGLVTRFTFAAVPEPGSFALVAAACVGAVAAFRVRGRR